MEISWLWQVCVHKNALEFIISDKNAILVKAEMYVAF